MKRWATRVIIEIIHGHLEEGIKAIIADTIKGKGIDFMENKIEWHFSSLTQEQYDDAKSQILEKY